jgi:hypothetical protein
MISEIFMVILVAEMRCVVPRVGAGNPLGQLTCRTMARRVDSARVSGEHCRRA